MRRAPLAALLAAALCSCLAADELGARIECAQLEDCPKGQVCFYGVCVNPGYSISSVYAELTPPSGSAWQSQQYPWPLELADGFQDLALSASVKLQGTVDSVDRSDLSGTLFARSAGVIPGLAIERQARVVAAAYSLDVVPGTYTLTFAPDDPLLPPREYPNLSLLVSRELNLSYWADSELRPVNGVVRFNAAVQIYAVGARVWGTAQAAGGGLLRSTTGETDNSGAFTLVFPSAAEVFTIYVGPGQGSVRNDVPEASFAGLTITEPPDGLPIIDLGVEPLRSVTAIVRDAEDRPVVQASVLFEGIVGSTQARFTAVSSTGDDGNGHGDVFPGRYVVTAAPGPGEYALQSQEAEFDLPGDAVVIRLRPKIKLSGVVTDASGGAISGAPLVLKLRGASIPRQYAVTTNAAGHYAVSVDPGEADGPAEYDLTVSPTPETGLPFYRGIIRVGDVDQIQDVRLYQATLVYGAVSAPSGAPLGNVLVAFYSQDLAVSSEPGGSPRAVLVGVVQTREDGSFVFPVPTVPPGASAAP